MAALNDRVGVIGVNCIAEMTVDEFGKFQRLIYKAAGISMSNEKVALVSGRLAKRLRHYNMSSYGEYYRLIKDDSHRAEFQMAVDLLTTNETYFFREQRHFDYLRDQILPSHQGGMFRVWSAASSSGEEAYTVAMMLADILGDNPWHILGTDISTRVLETARQAYYPLADCSGIPNQYLNQYCLKGQGEHEGVFTLSEAIKMRVIFKHMNLNGDWNNPEKYQLIFLRNIMIYFDQETKRRLVERLFHCLVPGGHLMIGHSETLNGMNSDFKLVTSATYQRPLT